MGLWLCIPLLAYQKIGSLSTCTQSQRPQSGQVLLHCLHTHHTFYVTIAVKLLIFFTYSYCINVDGVPQDFEEDFVDLWLLIVCCLLSAGGIGFAIACIVFDLVFRKKR